MGNVWQVERGGPSLELTRHDDAVSWWQSESGRGILSLCCRFQADTVRKRRRMTLEGWLNSLHGIPRHRAPARVLQQGPGCPDLGCGLNWAWDGFCRVHSAGVFLCRGSI